MNKNKIRVALVTGGPYEERKISFQSAQLVEESLVDQDLEVFKVDIRERDWIVMKNGEKIDKNDFSFLYKGNKIKFDVAYLMLHGSPAEDGKLQGYFDMMEIPYTGCNVFVSSLTFNKQATKNFLRAYNTTLASSFMLTQKNKIPYERIEEIGFPQFIKPNKAGSSYGVNKVKNMAEVDNAIEDAFKYDDEILIEEFIDGREFSCGVIPFNGNNKALPITELIPEGEFFDYDAKYREKSKEITPADLPDSLSLHCKGLSERLYELLGCAGIVRFDYILSDKRFYLLEVNTIPGLSPTSIVPQQIEALGLSVHTILQNILLERLGLSRVI